MPISLLHPKYLPTWFGFFVLWLIAKLPQVLQFSLGRTIGWLLFILFKSRVFIVKKNITWCFPNKESKEIDKLVKESVLNLGISLIELANCFYLSDKALKRRYVLEGLDNLSQYLKNNTPVVLLLGHFTTMLLAGRMLNQAIPIADVYFKQKNKLVDWMMRCSFEKHGATMVDNQDMRAMIKVLKNNLPLWYAPDQDYGLNGSVFVPFFNIETATTKATARLVKITKAAVVPFTYKRVNKKYHLSISPALKNYPNDDEVLNARITNEILEEQIKQNIAQYFWAHKRFKTRPNNEQNPY
jgi:lipid A biosynthesis lauroyl/palmitoleoyl acyltransferase